jgi:hypothetical protein
VTRIVQAISHYLQTVQPNNFVDLDAYEITNGKTLAKTGTKIRLVRSNAPVPDSFSVSVKNNLQPGLQPIFDERTFKTIFDEAIRMDMNIEYTKNTYGNVKHNPLFRKLYNIKNRDIKYERFDDNSGTFVEFQQSVESFTCVECGVVMPTTSMQIDHQRPKGQDNYEATLKAFRGFGFTKAGPKGPKGKIMQQLNYNKLFAYSTNSVGFQHTPVAPRHGLARPNDGSSLNDRYTLNDAGIVLISMAVGANMIDAIKESYVHSLYNLRPMCAGCNVGRNSGPQTKF